MQIIINIPEEMYAQIIDENGIDSMLIPYKDIIKNGTPLPKGHSRLIDVDDIDVFQPSFGTDEIIADLMAKHNLDYIYGQDEDEIKLFAEDLLHSLMNVINTAPTIIEAGEVEK